MRSHDKGRDMALGIKKKAYLLTAVVLLWQLEALVHLITITHEICPHGKVVQSRQQDEHHHSHSHDGTGSSHHRDGHHEGCRLLASLTTANIAAGGYHLVPTFIVDTYIETDDPRCTTIAIRIQEALFRLSPAQSPPTNA